MEALVLFLRGYQTHARLQQGAQVGRDQRAWHLPQELLEKAGHVMCVGVLGQRGGVALQQTLHNNYYV